MVSLVIFTSRKRVEAEVLEKAYRILDLRKRLSPAIGHLVRHDLFDENLDFIEWDKKLCDLHDFLMRERAGLREGKPPRPILRRTRAATTRLDDMLQRVEQFQARLWWADVAFDPV